MHQHNSESQQQDGINVLDQGARGTQSCVIGHGKPKQDKIKVCAVELWGKTKQLYYS